MEQVTPNTPTAVEGFVLDSHGMMVPPKTPFLVIEPLLRQVRLGWSSVADMKASIQANAPVSQGRPPGSPDPNDVYLDEKTGVLYRHIVDPDYTREMVISGDEVNERVQFKKRPISLTLAAARQATDSSTDEVDRTTDFWNGFTWLRGGYSPERDFTVMAQMAAIEHDNAPLVFEQPANPNDVARLRHDVERLNRNRPVLPITTVQASAAASSEPAMSQGFTSAMSLEEVLAKDPPETSGK